MKRVTGLGGIFFKAKDPKALYEWYRKHLGIESARGDDGLGITVSYWDSLESIRQWREHAEHRLAQHNGKAKWYAEYRLRVCKVEEEIVFKRERSEK